MEIALQVRCVDDIDDEVRLPGVDEVARDPLVQRDILTSHVQRLGAGQIDHLILGPPL
jgi:hypothetical protein